ncbi:hypothetical protein GCM10009547_37430 [Sporichthya brevicatena]|uniref:Peptidase M15C domain-containing protein n=1 Tax=Sporichthya brevicatena TaxID=171442 RepID=A0ABN1H6B3_9ACTN
MSRRWLSTLVVASAMTLLVPAGGAYADEADPAPTADAPATTPEPSPEASPEPTPDASPEPSPEASPEPTPEPTVEAPTFDPASVPGAAPAVPAAAELVEVAKKTKKKQPFNLKVLRVKRADVRYTYRSGCPVGPSNLRRLQLTFYGYDGKWHRGNIVVHRSAVTDVAAVFRRAYQAKFPIKRMSKVDKFRGSDTRSMAANNTSAFNCRHVVGNPSRLSQHSYGNAVDVNTRQNPYVTGSRVYPSGAATYLNRSNVRKGMLTRSGPIPREFARRGWLWGARWAHPDYQHFSSNGR